MTLEQETETAGKVYPDWIDETLLAHSLKGNTAECRVILTTRSPDGSIWHGEKVIKVRLKKEKQRK